MEGTAGNRPQKLSEKLLQIRREMNLSQTQMVKRLGLENTLSRSDISKYELGTREPSLPMLLRYARAVGISTDDLTDDEAEPAFWEKKQENSTDF